VKTPLFKTVAADAHQPILTLPQACLAVCLVVSESPTSTGGSALVVELPSLLLKPRLHGVPSVLLLIGTNALTLAVATKAIAGSTTFALDGKLSWECRWSTWILNGLALVNFLV